MRLVNYILTMNVCESQIPIVFQYVYSPLADITFSPSDRRQNHKITKLVSLDILAPSPLIFTL